MSKQSVMSVSDAVLKSRKDYGVSIVLAPSTLHSLADILSQSVRDYSNQPAVTSLGHTLTYEELDHLSTAFAAYLQQHTKLKKGDRLAIQMPSLAQYYIVAYGAFKAGLTVVNINPLYTEKELNHQFNHADVKAVVVFDKFLPVVEAVHDKTPIKYIFVTSPFDLHPPIKRTLMSVVLTVLGKSAPYGNGIPLRIALKTDVRGYTPVAISLDDMALLQYTGGTTGVSKPAIISHGNMISMTRQSLEMMQISSAKLGKERMVSPLPLYHIFAFSVSVMTGVYMGAHTLLIPNPRDINSFIRLLKKWPATFFSGINTLFVSLTKHKNFSKVNFSSLGITLSGGAALAEATASYWKDATGCEICNGYGLTEASPVVSVSPLGANKPGSVGIAIANTELQITDSHGQALAVDEHGEIWVRGPQVMQGYLNFPEETAKVLTAEGWLKTGDIGSVDKDGFLYIHDRLKDMIIVSGFNVYPNEIESVVSSHPDITYCAVIGVPDKRSGEAVKLFLVSTNPKLTEQEIKDFFSDKLARYKWPKYIEFRDELPLSDVGKVLRRELRDS